jgi:hypothetical protein
MKVSRQRQIGGIAVFLVVVGLVWRQVFVMTGILWWEAPRAAQRPAPPAAAVFKQTPSNWVDLPAYGKTNPVWPIDAP